MKHKIILLSANHVLSTALVIMIARTKSASPACRVGVASFATDSISKSKKVPRSTEKRASTGFWGSRSNQKQFFDSLSKTLGFSDLSGWYRVTKAVIHRHGGGGMLVSQYKDSVQNAITTVYPDHDWLPWRFQSVQRSYWAKRENTIAFFTWASKQLNVTQMEDWYNISPKRIRDMGAAGLLVRYHNNSLMSALQSVFPQHEWLEWRSKYVPRNFWKSLDNQRRFFFWLMKEMGRENQLEALYELSHERIAEMGGKRILQIYGYSSIDMVTSVFPLHWWMRWRFDSVPTDYWYSILNGSSEDLRRELQEFVDFKGNQLGVHRKEDWYRISRTQIDKVGKMASPIRIFGGLPKLLQRAYPDHVWMAEAFTSVG